METRYIATAYRRGLKPVFKSDALSTREKAARQALIARPQSRMCSTVRAVFDGKAWQDTGWDMRWHNRGELD